MFEAASESESNTAIFEFFERHVNGVAAVEIHEFEDSLLRRIGIAGNMNAFDTVFGIWESDIVGRSIGIDFCDLRFGIVDVLVFDVLSAGVFRVIVFVNFS